MSWDNHGVEGWHVDHIIPLASAQSLSELENLFHYTNLQPLWAEENRIKGANLPVTP
jgi:5-methylcytosine-specific restriction endonuclease McrA